MRTQDILNNTDTVFDSQHNTNVMTKHSNVPDHEVQMARADLYKLAKYAIKLHELIRTIPEDQGLEGWVQSKITKASDYISSVYHYLEYEMKFMEDNVDEQVVGAPGSPTATSTPGMVKMAKVGPDGKPIGTPIMVKSTEITGKQSQGMKVIGEMSSAGATSAGGIASGAGNGFKNGGPGTVARAEKVKNKKVRENDSDNEETYRVEVKLSSGSKVVRVQAGNDAEAEQKAMSFCQKKNLNPVSAKSQGIYYAEGKKNETGPKFTGYYKGTDKGRPGKKMVGSD
jgi:hypothetical protein